MLAEPDIGQRLRGPARPAPWGSDLEPVEGLAHQLLDLPGRVRARRPVICSPPTGMFPVAGPAARAAAVIVVVLPEPDRGEANY